MNTSFGRKVKHAYKNTQREYEKYRLEQWGMYMRNEITIWRYYTLITDKEEEVCLKHSYPLGLYATSFSCFANLVRSAPHGSWRIIGRLCRAARRKGMTVYPYDVTRFIASGQSDWRKLQFRTYNISRSYK